MSYSSHFDLIRSGAILILVAATLYREIIRRRARGRGERVSAQWADWVMRGLLGLVLVQTFFLCPFRITSGSMLPTLPPGAVVIGVRQWIAGSPGPGQVAIFTHQGQTVVKRILAGPGQTVTFADGTVRVDGQVVRTALKGDDSLSVGPLAPQMYFMMGDNPQGSTDSRAFGPVARAQLWGRAWLVLWPSQKPRIL